MADRFVTITIDDIIVGEPLPADVAIYIDFRFITFRAAGDTISQHIYDRLERKQLRNLFIKEPDLIKFRNWTTKYRNQSLANVVLTEENKKILTVKENVKRKVFDIFSTNNPNKIVEQGINASKTLVTELTKNPYGVKSLAILQGHSQGTVDHSVNVSVLSVYLALQMGYSHQVILSHIGLGALLHDIGKTKIEILDTDSKEVIDKKLQSHPIVGGQIVASDNLPSEVKFIIEQHHENFDGTGYPNKLKGKQIYDLARIVHIANVFDSLVGDATGPLMDRQKAALKKMETELVNLFDPQKLQKCLKILRLGL